jgi:ribosomal protein S20
VDVPAFKFGGNLDFLNRSIKTKKRTQMPKVYTSLSQAQVERIEQSGKTIYQFLKEAVEEKFINDEEKKELNSYEQNLIYRLEQFDKKLEEKLLKVLEIHHSERISVEVKFDEMVERYENSRTDAKSIMKDISTELKRLKSGN